MADTATADAKRLHKFLMVSLLARVACVIAAPALFYPPVAEYLDRMICWTADRRTALLADPFLRPTNASFLSKFGEVGECDQRLSI